MGTFPATHELIAFTLCLFAFGLAVKGFFRVESAIARIFGPAVVRVLNSLKFPRQLIRPDVSVLKPPRRLTFKHFIYRFKFTFFMVFLNVYTFAFTTDFTNGEINPDVLESRGFSYMHFAQHKWFILLTSNFIHFHLQHLVINMLMLLLFSGALELLKGARFAAIVYLVSMNSNVPNGLFLLPGLKILFPQMWNQTVQYVDVGASLGIMGSLGGLARLLTFKIRALVMGAAVLGALFGAVYIHNLFGIDHAFSALIGYVMASYLLQKERRKSEVEATVFALNSALKDLNETDFKRTGTE